MALDIAQQVREEIRRLNRVLAILEGDEEVATPVHRAVAAKTTGRRGRTLSPEARQRMKEAQERRWKAVREVQQQTSRPAEASEPVSIVPEQQQIDMTAPSEPAIEPEKRRPAKRKR
jgi:hypothetical protein